MRRTQIRTGRFSDQSSTSDEYTIIHGQSDDAFKNSFINPQAGTRDRQAVPRLVKLEGSDLHLKVGKPPMVRVNGTLRPMNRGPIDDEEMVRLCFPLMNERNRKIFERRRRRRLRPHVSTSTASTGGSASTCCSSWATSAWSPAASTTGFPTSKG